MADKTFDVVGIGNAIVDIIARCDEGFLSKHGLAKGSMRLIDADEANRLYSAMGPAVERSGGSVANAIAGLASFGARCGFIGRVAADRGAGPGRAGLGGARGGRGRLRPGRRARAGDAVPRARHRGSGTSPRGRALGVLTARARRRA